MGENHNQDIHQHMGETGSIRKIRSILEDGHNMVQLMMGKAQNDSDFISYISEDKKEFAVVTSEAGSSEYTISFVGEIFFVHEKNFDVLARSN